MPALSPGEMMHAGQSDGPPAAGRRGGRQLARSLQATFVDSRYGLLFLGLAVLLIVGLANLTHYGASVDEWHNTFYGGLFLRAYETGNLLRSPEIDYFNGPFYFMVFNVTAALFHALNPRWLFTDGLHLTNFLAFLTGLFFFYRIALRLVPRGMALFVTALLATQPVLFGHAFINQKDTPLMVFFLASVELGLSAADARNRAASASASRRARPDPLSRQTGSSAGSGRAQRLALAIVGLLIAIVMVDAWLLGNVQDAARLLLARVYAGEGPGFLLEVFERVAEDAYKTPLTAYMAKLERALFWGRIAVTPLAAALLLRCWSGLLPASFARFAQWMRAWGIVLAAGIVLGLAVSIRMLAPFAGLLVAVYWLSQSGRRAIPGLVLYGASAAVTTYLTWPVLWGNPLIALSDRISEVSEFSRYGGLFLGARYQADDLPWRFLPVLLGVQFTLPAVFLFAVGVPYSLVFARQRHDAAPLLGLIWLWFLLPVVAVVLGIIPIYNNFRHVLFAIPPAFLIMGLVGSWIASKVRRPVLLVVLACLALAPGIVGIVSLHPYEYIYYNQLVGGVRGAEGKFDLDYWCTAFRQAMAEVDRVAPEGAHIDIARGLTTAAPFARQDLLLTQGADTLPNPDFALACRRDVNRSTFHAEMQTIYEVRIDGALIAVVKQRVDAP